MLKKALCMMLMSGVLLSGAFQLAMADNTIRCLEEFDACLDAGISLRACWFRYEQCMSGW